MAGAVGAKEPLKRQGTRLSSSMGGAGSEGWDPEKMYLPSFFGETPRERPVRNLHGCEIAGTVALPVIG